MLLLSKMAPTGGLEPPTKRLEVFCAIQLRHVGKMAGVAGLKPAHTRVKVSGLITWLHPNLTFFDKLNTVDSYCADVI